MKLRDRADWRVVTSVLFGVLIVVAAVVLYGHASTSCWGGECQGSQYDQPMERR